MNVDKEKDKKIDAFVQEIDQSDAEVYLFQLYKEGKLLREHKWDQENQLRNIHSIAKTITSLATGFAIEDGLIGINDTLGDLFPEYRAPKNNQAMNAIKVSHMLSMSMGQGKSLLMLGEREKIKTDDWAKYVLNEKFEYAPGSSFLYSNAGHYLLGVAIQRKSETNLLSYLSPRLFEPLQIEKVQWEQDPKGYHFGAGGVKILSSDLHKFGSLLMNDGSYEGKQLLNKEFITKAKSPITKLDNNEAYATHYGYGLWINRRENYYRADGAFGQILLQDPNKEMSIVIHSKHADNDALLEKITRLILTDN